jgi:hypothetical protein
MFCLNPPRRFVIETYVNSLTKSLVYNIYPKGLHLRSSISTTPSMSHTTCCYFKLPQLLPRKLKVTSSDPCDGHVFFESCFHLKYSNLVGEAVNNDGLLTSA